MATDRVTQVGVEYADTQTATTRVSQLGLEVAVSVHGTTGQPLFRDTFDDYPDDDPFDKWTTSPVPANCTISASYGRTGKGLRLNGTSISKALTPADNVCEFSAWIYLNDSSVATILQVYANSNPDTAQTCVTIATDGTVNVYSWPGVTLLGSSAAGVFPRTTWTCFYYRTTVNDTGGTYEVRVNGVPVVSGSGDTAHFGGTSWSGVRVGSNTDVRIDDVWAGDGTKTWLGCNWALVGTRVSQFGVEYAGPRIIQTLVTQFGVEVALPYVEEIFEPGQSFGPLVWVEVLGPDGDTRAYAPVALPDPSAYYWGWKPPALLGVGRVARALSDEHGQYESQRFSTTLDDMDRQWRIWLGDVATRLILNKRVVLRMISEPAWRAKLRPRTVALGLIRDYRLE